MTEGYTSLYRFHVVVEPFRFMFHMPVKLASWMPEERIAKPRLHSNLVTECGLLRGQKIKMSKKGTGLTDEEIGEEIRRFLGTDLSE